MSAADSPVTAMDVLQMLEQIPGELHDAYLTLNEQPIEAMIYLLAEVRRARARLDLLGKAIEDDITFLTAAKRLEVEGIGEVEIKTSTATTKWNHDDLVRRVTALALDERLLDETTGEYEPAWEAVARVLTECGHIDYWRKTALRDHGLDPDEFAETSYGRKTVKMKALPL